ncbi:hypothetical protein GBA52_021865 [Prunus armeniaca]|nr:hypothetical protein GBA52_021865 [Prunus armeniaca]
MISKFWWKNLEYCKDISWAKWEHLCFARDEGGLGFRTRRLWLSNVGYFLPMNTSKGRASSYVWRSLIWGRELLLNGIRKRIRDGQDTLVYGDAWIPRPNSFRPFFPQVLDQETKECSGAAGSSSEPRIRNAF